MAAGGKMKNEDLGKKRKKGKGKREKIAQKNGLKGL